MNNCLISASTSGGCGCKAPTDMLRSLLTGAAIDPTEGDDAAIVDAPLNCVEKLVASVDFGGPLVGNGHDWGRIVTAHAHSDTYAMGGIPRSTLAIVGLTDDAAVNEQIGLALRSAKQMCHIFGAPIVGGHTTVLKEPMLGLVSIGDVSPQNVKRKSDAQAGDVIILTKPIGIGLYAGALRDNSLSIKGYRELISVASQVNFIGSQLGRIAAVHAMTDVTGFGLIGHAIEIGEASNVSVRLEMGAIPLMEDANQLVDDGYSSGIAYATASGLAHKYGHSLSIGEASILLLADPQTSGGLLITCAANFADPLVKTITSAGFHRAAIIGEVAAEGPPLFIH